MVEDSFDRKKFLRFKRKFQTDNINKKVLYEFECYIYIGKVFCDFKGKIKAYQYPIAANQNL